MTRYWRAWTWAAGAIALLSLGAVAPDRSSQTADLTWSPSTPVQGQLFLLRVAAPEGRSVRALSGQVADEPLHFVEGPDGAWESLAAVPIGTTGSIEVSVSAEYADGSSEALVPSVPVGKGNYVHERLTVAPEFGTQPDSARQALLAIDRAKAREVSRVAHLTPRLWSGDLTLPRDDRVTSGFGDGRIFNDEVSSRHMGLDLDGEPGDTVVAVTHGVVALVDEFVLAGNIVYLNHGAGLISGYFHLSEQLVAAGDSVEAGTPIGRVGATGRVTGPHLHWVVRYGYTSVDPRSLLEVGPM